MCLAANFISARSTIINDQFDASKLNEWEKIKEVNCSVVKENSFFKNNNVSQDNSTPTQNDRIMIANIIIYVLEAAFLCFLIIACLFQVMVIPTLILAALLSIIETFGEMVNFHLRINHSRCIP